MRKLSKPNAPGVHVEPLDVARGGATASRSYIGAEPPPTLVHLHGCYTVAAAGELLLLLL
jgi:hypothetical protein